MGFSNAGDCVLFSLRSLGEGKSASLFFCFVFWSDGPLIMDILSQNSGVSFHVERGSPSPRGMWSSKDRCLQGEEGRGGGRLIPKTVKEAGR